MKKTIGKISDVCKVFAGQSPKGTSYNENCLGMEFHQGKKAFGDFFLGKSNVWTTEITTTAEPGDILMSVRAPVGPTNITQRKICIGRGLAAIRCREKVIPSFVLYALKNIENKIEGNNGAVFNSINKKMIEKLPIPIIGKDEQQRIVTYLDSTFAKIDAVAKNAEKSLNDAKALFLSALAKMMEPKEGWEEVSMDELCSIESALVNPTKADYINMLHVGGANIESYSGKLVNLKTAKEEKLSSGKFFFDNKAVLYNKIRPYLVKVAKPDFCGLCSADMYPLSPKNKVTREFLYYILISKDFTDYAIKSSARAGMPKINRNSLFAYKTSIPKDYKEQICITSKLDSIRRGLITLESNLTLTLSECAALKQSILRQTFE